MFFVLTFTALLILPGYLLAALLAPHQPWFQRLPTAFSLTLALLGLPAVLLLNLHAPLSLLAWLALSITLILAVLHLTRFFRHQKSTNQQANLWLAINQSTRRFRSLSNYPITNYKLLLPLLLATILAAAFTLYLFISTAAIRDFGDHWFYLHFIRHYLDYPLNPALNPLVGQEVAPGTLSRAATNGWWVLVASLVQLSGRPLLDAYWLYLPPTLMVISLLAFYALAWELFENHRIALTAVLLQLLLHLTTIGSHDWIGQGFFTRIAEDKYLVWLVLLPVSLFLLLRYIKTSQFQFLILLAGSVVAIAITHPYGLLQFAFAAACLALVNLPFTWRKNSRLKSAVLLAPILLFLIVPIIQLLFSGTAALTQFSPAELQTPPNDTHLIVLSAENNRYLLHPHLIFHPLILISIFLAPLLLLRIRKSIPAQFLFATTILPLLLLYNAITAPLLGRFLSALLLWRIIWILPTTLVLAYFLNKLTTHISEITTYQLPITNYITIILILILTLSLSAYIADGIDLLQDYKTRTVTADQQSLLNYLCETGDRTGVIIADPLLNTLLPTCSPEARLLTYRIFQARETAAEEIDRFYQSRLLTQSTISFLESWQARYIILPQQAPIAPQINLLPDLFARQYTNATYSLYEVIGTDHPIIDGNEALIRGDWSWAETAYSLGLEQNPSSALAYFGLGQLGPAQGDNAAAETALRQAIALEPTFTSPYLSLAALYEQNGRTAEAQSLLLQALAHNPDNQLIHKTLGDLYLELGSQTAAVEQYQQAIPLTANQDDQLLALARLYNEKGLTAAAISTYEAVIDHQSGLLHLSGGPGFWPLWSRSLTFDRRPERLAAAYQALGQLYERQGSPASAEAAYRQLIRLQPTRETSYHPLAALLNQTNRLPETIALYQEAARLNFHLSWPYRRLAEAYLTQYERDESQTNLLTQALSTLQKAQQIEPENTEGYQLLAQTYQLLDQPQQAVTLYRQAAETYAFAAWPQVSLAQYYLETGDFSAAEAALTAAISRQPAEQTAYNLLADAYLNRRESAAAVQLYQRAVSQNESRAWPYLGLGNAYLAAGMNDLALAALRDGLAREPDNAAVYSTLGNIYRWNVGDPETAVAYYRQSISLNFNQADTHMALASTLISLGREDEALPHLETALALDPLSGLNYQAAGDIMWQLDRLEEAAQYYHQALTYDPKNAFAHLGLTRIYHQQQRYELALEQAQLAVRFSQSAHATGPAQMEQGQIYLALGRPEEALPHLLAAVEALPADPWFQATLGDYYHYQQNDPVQAIPYYQQAADLAPQQAILQAALGTALYDAGQIDEALPVMEQAITLNGADAAVFLRIGSVLNQYGDWQRLVQFYETAVANGIQNAAIFTQLGNAYTALGQEDKALVQYQKAAALETSEQ